MLKPLSTFFLILLLISSAGCSSISSIQSFSSKQKLYDNFNRSAADKNLTIVMNNDSTFTAPYGAMVLNDTLDVFVRGSGADILLPLNKVKRVSYKKRWLGILPGLLIGTGAAFMSAGADYSLNAPWLFFVTFPGCIIGGAVWGYLGGYNYVYLFNQSNISNNGNKK